MQQSIRDFASRFVNIPPDGLAGDPEGGGCLFLFETLQVDQVQYCQFFGQQ
jgi:hypothetical protein